MAPSTRIQELLINEEFDTHVKLFDLIRAKFTFTWVELRLLSAAGKWMNEYQGKLGPAGNLSALRELPPGWDRWFAGADLGLTIDRGRFAIAIEELTDLPPGCYDVLSCDHEDSTRT